MPVKGLTGEQLSTAWTMATGFRSGNEARMGREVDPVSARGLFLDKFALPGRKADPKTSILQALSLMNGDLSRTATDVDKQ